MIYSKHNLLFEIVLVKHIPSSKEFKGIRNEGNTCYMNSIIQILYFLRPFRKLIIESKS